MTTKAKPRKPARKAKTGTPRKLVTMKEAAAMDFKPWEADATPEETMVPELAEIENPHLIRCRIAYHLLHKTKPELVKMWEKDPDFVMKMMTDMENSRKLFHGMAELIHVASTRLFVAGASATENA